MTEYSYDTEKEALAAWENKILYQVSTMEKYKELYVPSFRKSSVSNQEFDYPTIKSFLEEEGLCNTWALACVNHPIDCSECIFYSSLGGVASNKSLEPHLDQK